MDNNSTETYKIDRVKNNESSQINDLIIKETPLLVIVNQNKLVNLMALPEKLKELTIGWLASEGIIENINEIKSLNLSKDRTIINIKLKKDIDCSQFKTRTITSGCAKGSTFNNKEYIKDQITDRSISIRSNMINKLMVNMQEKSLYFNKTGGTHTAALGNKKKLLYVIEDIGRHNTIDKIIGKSLLKNLDLSDKIILTSGRVSSEIINKVSRQKIPILISRSAPTAKAIDLARQKNLTLIGFTRGSRYNIYNDQKRILF